MATPVSTLTIGVKADTSDFDRQIERMSKSANEFSGTISRAFKDAVIGGRSLDTVLSGLLLRLSGMALDKALQPLSNLIGNLVGGVFGAFGLGGAPAGGVGAGLAHGGVTAFAQGGVVSSPTLFPLARGLGLMGEAGAEAVLPLARGGDGTLGVRTSGAASLVVNFNVTTADADSFRKSETQLTAMLARAVGRGRRGL